MKRIVCGSFVNPVHPQTGRRPDVMRLIRDNMVEAYSWANRGLDALASVKWRGAVQAI